MNKRNTEKDTQNSHNVALQNELPLRSTININRSILGSVKERWPSDLVPHLSGDHSEAEEQRRHCPHLAVAQKLEVVPPHV